MTLIGDLFEKDVTRDIPPVVSFHEQTPERLADEVSEYIITGGYDEKDPRAVHGGEGIHEQFVRLLTGIATALRQEGGSGDPACWISGFYGSGKSSFAKLLGLALDGRQLPDGRPLAEALLAQDHSPDAPAFQLAWEQLAAGIAPMAVVFDIGAVSRGDEHIHVAVLRECQKRLGYSTTPAVAEFELSLELEGQYEAFLEQAKAALKKPWSELSNSRMAADHFSEVMHALQPERYRDPMAWYDSRAGSHLEKAKSAQDVVEAVGQMLQRRASGRHLFIVIDEVSQYVHDNQERMLTLQSLVKLLGDYHRGRVWLLATGQQKLEEDPSGASVIPKLQARFPTHLRVHLGSANIRDVVHRRLLKKRQLKESELRELYQKYRSELALYAYECADLKEQDFVDVYPMLPGHIDLLMEITTGLRTRSTRVQGDSHAIRGLLQLLGDLFREQHFARRELGQLITLDKIYNVQYTALSPDVQTTLSRALTLCNKDEDEVAERVVKAVALLELIQDQKKTDAELIARCLYARLGQGSELDAVGQALGKLRAAGLLDYSEKTGYKIQSSAGQEWQAERNAHVVEPDKRSGLVSEALARLMADVGKVKLGEMGLPWRAFYSDGRSQLDTRIKDERKHTVLTVSFHIQFGKGQPREHWVQQSAQEAFINRLLWVSGDSEAVVDAARELARSTHMVNRYAARQSSLSDEQQRLLIQERNQQEAAFEKLQKAVAAAFLAGCFYFRGRPEEARELGGSFGAALEQQGGRVVKQLYPNPVSLSVSEKDLAYLFAPGELSAPPRVFARDQLGLLEQDSGRFEMTCSGQVPQDILRYIADFTGVSGSTLLEHFGSPPFGYPADVVRACLVGLLRASKIQVTVPGLGELTSVRDIGAREFVQDRNLRKAELVPKKDTSINPRGRNAACKFFETQFEERIARENDAIADAVAKHFAGARERLTAVEERLRRLPDAKFPATLGELARALENCRRKRQVEPTVKAVISHLAALSNGMDLLRRLETDLTDQKVSLLREAADVQELLLPQLDGQVETASYAQHASALSEHLQGDRPWNDVGALAPQLQALRTLYRKRREEILAAQQAQVDASLAQMKRRHGFDTLNVDQQQDVLRHLREGAPLHTTADATAPELAHLDAQFAARLQAAEAKALAQLDDLLEDQGESPTVTVELGLVGRELNSTQQLARFLEELDEQLRPELESGHRVRLR